MLLFTWDPYRTVLKERKPEMELPPMPLLSPMAKSEPPPPPAKADTKVVVMQPAFKRIEDRNRETYKARWHVSKAAAASTLLTNP
jgi:hypothetical protein